MMSRAKVKAAMCFTSCFPGRAKVPITSVLGGDCFDICFEACIGNYWKHPEIVQWLLYIIPLSKNDNYTKHALLILLECTETIAQLHVGAIFSLSVIVPLHWLSSETHLLEHWKWGERHMASAFDCVYTKCQKIKEHPELVLNKNFMMSVFFETIQGIAWAKGVLTLVIGS